MSSSSSLAGTFGSLLQTSFDHEGFAALSSLSPTDRILAYYLSRAAIAGYRVALFQLCPYPSVIERLHQLITNPPADADKGLLGDISAWWVYLFANFGVHCQRESENNKKVPSDMKLGSVTRAALEGLGVSFSEDEWRYLFDPTFFPTATVQENIEQSGNSFYPRGYTQAMYSALSQDAKDCLVAYHTPEGTKTYGANGVCAAELSDVVKWLKLALSWSESHGDVYPAEMASSLALAIEHFESGEERHFKEHSKVWTRLQSRVEYTIGFIEYYDDPMSHIGTFQADVTIKSRDISPLLRKLPSFEQRFPFPPEYKRKDMSTIPNAAPAHKVVGIGGLGPVFSTLAYCLPNYNDLRSEFGSKQVMYPQPDPADVNRYLAIYYSQEDRDAFAKYSPDLALEHAVSSLVTTLHETIGHASGSMIEGVTEKVRNERLGRWGNGLEEMRAEILALYTFFAFYDEIVGTGFLGEWPSKAPKDLLLRLAIDDVAGGGWRRWRGLPSGTTTVTQAHALADTGIMYYLIDAAPQHFSLVREEVSLEDGEKFDGLRLRVRDVGGVFPYIEELAGKVQHMSSTADVALVNEFMLKYAASTRDVAYADIVTHMRDAQNHGVIETVNVFPEFQVAGGEGEEHIRDAIPIVPSEPLGHFLRLYEMSRPGSQ